MTRLHINASAISLAVLFASYSALAQQATATAGVGVQGQAAAATPAPPLPAAPADANAGQTNQQNQTSAALPAATNANPPPAGNSEHDDMVGHLAVGFLGLRTIPYGLDNTYDSAAAPVPVIGVRYWIDPLIGLDLGAGLWIGGRSSESTNPTGTKVSVDGPKPFAMVLHAGVPLALASSKHFAFEIIPEANFGFAKVTQDATLPGTNDGTTKQSGTHFDLGARAGAEIHFGFIGIPQLSLVGSVGLRFQYDSLTHEVNPGGTGVTKTTSSVWDLSTTVNGNPWDIFAGNISALYYL
jgi:hypothetical protein